MSPGNLDYSLCFLPPAFLMMYSAYKLNKQGKDMTNLNSILKIRDITFLTKVHIVKVMVFPVVMYRYESWTLKKAEH